MVKDVKERSVIVQDANKEIREIPYGLLVWATGNTSREITKKLMAALPQAQNQRRGLVVDDYMAMVGANGIYALGDCTATSYAPTAQVASQQGMYLASMFAKLGQKAKLERELAELRTSNADAAEIESTVKKLTRAAKVSPFHYSHQVRLLCLQVSNRPRYILLTPQGSLAYIGSEKAIADLPFFNGNFASGGAAAMLFWRSAYVVSPSHRSLISMY